MAAETEGASALNTPHGSRRRRATVADRSGAMALSVLCVIFFLLPVLALIYGAFRSAEPGVSGGHWEIQDFISVYTSAATYQSIGGSLLLATIVVAVSTAFACYLAFIAARTSTIAGRILTPAMGITFAIPPLFYALSWGALGQRPNGTLNYALHSLLGTHWSPFNTQSWPGLVVVEVLRMTAASYLLLIGPVRALDASFSEAGIMSGAGRWRALITLELPALGPAVLGVMMLSYSVMLGALDTPLLLGYPAKIHLLSLDIFSAIYNQQPPNYAESGSLSIFLIIAVLLLVLVQRRILQGRDFTTITGKLYRASAWHLSRTTRLVTNLVVFLLVALVLVVPLAELVYASFQPYFGVYQHLTLANYRQVFETTGVRSAFVTTFIVSAVGGLVSTVIAVAVAVLRQRSRSLLRSFPDTVIWLLWAVPGITIGVGVSWAYLSIPPLAKLYATIWIVIIALVARVTPVATRAVGGAIVQVSRQLEEAARVCGSSGIGSFIRIALRLILPSFFAAWAVTAIAVGGNFEIPILLSSPTTQTVPLLTYNLYTSGSVSEAAAASCVFIGILACLVLIYMISARAMRGRRRRDRASTADRTDAARAPVSVG